MERRSVLFYVIAALVAIAVVLLTIFIYFKIRRANCEDLEEICLSPECVQAAAQILNYLDTTINPCDNFYAFACGNFLSNVEISVDEGYISTSSNMYKEFQRQLRDILEEPLEVGELKHLKLLKTYYGACNDEVAIEQQGLDPVKNILEKVGGWPVLNSSWNENDFDLYNYLYKLKEFGMDFDFLVTLTITDEIENSGRRIIKVDVPRLSVSPNLLTTTINNEFVRIYYHYMVSVAKKMGANESTAVDELNHSLEFEVSLAHISTLKEKPLIMNLSALDDKFPNIPWFEYIHNMMLPHVVITKSEKILVSAPGYIKSLDLLLRKASKRILANYIMWRTVETLIPYLGEELLERAFAFESAVYDISEKPPRWQQCVQETYDRFLPLLSSVYVQRHFDTETKENAKVLVQTIEEEFRNTLENLVWTHSKEKRDAIMNVSTIINRVGYSDVLFDVDKLEQMYDKLKINQDKYLLSHLNINLFNRAMVIKSLRKPVIEESLIDEGIRGDVGAFYTPSDNSMVVSVGALRGLLFNKDHPGYLNFGGLGFTVAREITKAFDWWEVDIDNVEKLQCFVRQYGNFTVQEINEQVNSTATLSTSVADNTGVRIAYLAYQKWVENHDSQKYLAALEYTPNQLFWISFALNQCYKQKPDFMKLLINEFGVLPAEFMVIGAVANLEDFAKDFKCDVKTPMNRLNKCTLW